MEQQPQRRPAPQGGPHKKPNAAAIAKRVRKEKRTIAILSVFSVALAVGIYFMADFLIVNQSPALTTIPIASSTESAEEIIPPKAGPAVTAIELADTLYVPSEGAMTIKYLVDQDCQVHVSIQKPDGTTVRRLNEEWLDVKAGVNRITWDGKDENGKTLAEGKYQVLVDAGIDGDITGTETKDFTVAYSRATPTPQATAKPTAKATVKPTAKPTEKPTAKPTAEPTAKPTAEPTAKPTVKPTAEPTAKPTAEPTAKPTQTPTNSPAAPTPDDGDHE
ncbi:FlgD immunoglobulin-like domain containing protein [Luoshenia tenuis]|uniref:FlgD immunoglobulin-like domain containing protein n=1 Tax=Luoshenia tenuis TaxID=2763654 RepID=UPI0024B4C481|nr:PT domain-containing protein [Luoshenia tenuis]